MKEQPEKQQVGDMEAQEERASKGENVSYIKLLRDWDSWGLRIDYSFSNKDAGGGHWS